MIHITRYFAFILIISIAALSPGCAAQRELSTDDIETGSMTIPPEAEFEVVESSAVVIEKSLAREGLLSGFIDSNADGVPDGVKWGDRDIRGNISPQKALGYAYGNDRYVVFYPGDVDSIPAPGEIKLLGFMHYFDDAFLDIPLAVILKQKANDAAKTGTQVALVGSVGKRVGNPAYALYPRRDIEAMGSYPRWSSTGLDFALAADPRADQFFILLADLGLPDEVMIIAFKWFK